MRNEIPKEEKLAQALKPKTKLVEGVEERLKGHDKLGINIGCLEGHFLQALVSQQSVEKVVEIGTQYGCSTAYIAESLGGLGEIYAFEKNEDCLEQARATFASDAFKMTGCKIELISGDAREGLQSIEQRGPFDLVFIDANKNAYLDYYLWAKEFLRPGGYLVIDNVFLFGTVFEETKPEKIPNKMWVGMKSLLQTVFSDSSMTASLVPTQEGLLFAVKNVPDNGREDV